MIECTEANLENSIKIDKIDQLAIENSAKIGESTLSFSKRLHELDGRVKTLDELLHKPNNFMELLRKETDKIDTRISNKVLSLQEQVAELESKRERDNLSLQAWQIGCDEIAALNADHFQKMNRNY